MKLSEAILLGSVGTGQCRGYLRDHEENTCALGAALTATGFDFNQNTDYTVVEDIAYNLLSVLWPWADTEVEHPMTGWKDKGFDVIWSLNDTYHWTRPRIAEWVASLEQQQEVKEHNGGLVEEEVQLR